MQQLEVSLATFSTQCGLDVPATLPSLTIVGRQSPSERTSGLALARATSVADQLRSDLANLTVPITRISTETAPVPARSTKIPTQSATVKLALASTPSPACG